MGQRKFKGHWVVIFVLHPAPDFSPISFLSNLQTQCIYKLTWCDDMFMRFRCWYLGHVFLNYFCSGLLLGSLFQAFTCFYCKFIDRFICKLNWYYGLFVKFWCWYLGHVSVSKNLMIQTWLFFKLYRLISVRLIQKYVCVLQLLTFTPHPSTDGSVSSRIRLAK